MSEYTPLPTNFVDDELALSQNGKRTYNIVDGEGNIVAENVHLEDVSTYTVVGSTYGAEQINEQNETINQIKSDLSEKLDASAITYTDTVLTIQPDKVNPAVTVYAGLDSSNAYDPVLIMDWASNGGTVTDRVAIRYDGNNFYLVGEKAGVSKIATIPATPI